MLPEDRIALHFCDLLFDFCTTQQQKSASIALLTSPFLNIPLRLMKVLRGLLYMDKRSKADDGVEGK